jgi:hypothetical protein
MGVLDLGPARITFTDPGGQPERLTADQIAKLSPADRLDYTRQRSQQTEMPEWRDPRK